MTELTHSLTRAAALEARAKGVEHDGKPKWTTMGNHDEACWVADYGCSGSGWSLLLG